MWTFFRKPMTFADIRAQAFAGADQGALATVGVALHRGSIERSLRRALQRMVSEDVLIAKGATSYRWDPQHIGV